MPMLSLGWCGHVRFAMLSGSCRFSLDGAIPLNTSGGLLGETGMPGMQLVLEGVRQIRGQCGPRQVNDASVGIVSGQGGIMTTHATMIIGDRP